MTIINRVSLILFLTASLLAYGMIPEISYVSTQNNDNDVFEFDDPSTMIDNQLVDKAYSMAPVEIHDLVHALKANLSPEASMCPRLFVGPPGTGKTLLASILASVLNKPLKEILALEGLSQQDVEQKCNFFQESNTNFYYKYVNASEFGNHYQHSKQHALKKLILNILATKKHCVLVVDEVNALFSGQKNENSSQALETALALKHLFERLEISKKIVPIFTTNYPEQIPKKYGLRDWFLQGNVFHFAQPDFKKRLMALQYHLKKSPSLNVAALNEGFYIPTNNFIEKFVKNKLGGWSFRRIAALCDQATQYALMHDDKDPNLLITRLEEAFHALQENYDLLKFNQEEPSEQERFCNENLALQEKFHKNQLRLSEQTMEFNHNLHKIRMVAQLRANNTSIKKGTYYPYGTHFKYFSVQGYDGWELDGVLPGDSKKTLPNDIQFYVDNKKPLQSLYDKHKKEKEKK